MSLNRDGFAAIISSRAELANRDGFRLESVMLSAELTYGIIASVHLHNPDFILIEVGGGKRRRQKTGIELIKRGYAVDYRGEEHLVLRRWVKAQDLEKNLSFLRAIGECKLDKWPKIEPAEAILGSHHRRMDGWMRAVSMAEDVGVKWDTLAYAFSKKIVAKREGFEAMASVSSNNDNVYVVVNVRPFAQGMLSRSVRVAVRQRLKVEGYSCPPSSEHASGSMSVESFESGIRVADALLRAIEVECA